MSNDENSLYVDFNGPISDVSVHNLRCGLLSHMSQIGNIDNLYLTLNSSGGSIKPGLDMYYFLKGLEINVTTHNMNRVDSIASIIFLAGNNRYANSHSSFLIHGMTINQTFQDSPLYKLEEIVNNCKQDLERMTEIYIKETALCANTISDAYINGLTLDASVAQEKRLISEIKDFEIKKNVKHYYIDVPKP